MIKDKEYTNEVATEFDFEVSEILRKVREMIREEKCRYGETALNPFRIFSRSSSEEQLLTMIDDKLSRIANRTNAGVDNLIDLIGYLVLLHIIRSRGQ